MTIHHHTEHVTLHHGDVELAYLAGVMDSDGWFTIKREDRQAPSGSRWVTYSEIAGCGQVRPEAVELLHRGFGGAIRERRREGHPTWQPMYYWLCQGRAAAELAAALSPYLRIKREHAALLLDLRASKDRPFSETRVASTSLRGRALSPAVVAERHRLFLTIRAMNDRRRRVEDGAA